MSARILYFRQRLVGLIEDGQKPFCAKPTNQTKMDSSLAAISIIRLSHICSKEGKVIRILKKRVREMSRSSKVLRTFEFLHVFGTLRKSKQKFKSC